MRLDLPEIQMSSIEKELSGLGIFNAEEGLFFVREALKLTKSEYDSATSRLLDFDRLINHDSRRAQRKRWDYIKRLGVSFYCFQRLQQLSREARQYLWDEYEARNNELNNKEVL